MNKPSVTDPISAAWNTMALVLFKPFNLGKWFVLGFAAFLSLLGQNGGNFPSGNWGGGPAPPNGQQITQWIQANAVWILAGVMLIMAIWVLIVWLRCRGTFMFIHGIATNNPSVVEPWKKFAKQGNSLLFFTLLLEWGTIFLSLCWIALGLALAWPDLEQNQFESAAILGLCVGLGALILTWIASSILGIILQAFVAPAMYARRVTVGDAWAMCRRDLFGPHFGSVVLFILMNFILDLAVNAVAVVATCATCCVAAIPYIGTVILLPCFVFMRCYSLHFVEQLGSEWKVFASEDRYCAQCTYDLSGSPSYGTCPECGSSYGVPPVPPIAPPSPDDQV